MKKKIFPKSGKWKGMEKSIPIIRERESEAFILGNGQEREFPFTPSGVWNCFANLYIIGCFANYFFVEFIFHLQEMGLLDKVHLKLLLWIVCVLRLFIKSENSSIDFYNNCSIFTVSVNCLSVDTFHNIRK